MGALGFCLCGVIENTIYPVALGTLYQVHAFVCFDVRDGLCLKGDCVCNMWAHTLFVSVM